ncbi:MAG: hypothetical protein OXJ62_14705 [Spirochaetaceae bacterium]|nr:hypothetical protein [Spirochaetaceae bacterium]
MTDDNGHRDPATPQEIWEILREISAVQQETARRMQETDRRMQETDRRMQETDRRLQATDELIARQTRAADRRIDELDKLFNGQWGKLIESLVEGDLVRLLQQRGIEVQHTVTNPRQNYGERRWELDIVAVNGDEVVVVEVKTTLRVPDIDRFMGRLNEFSELMPEYASRRVYGAVAYLKAYQESDVRAERLGLFVIRATGSSASITNREGFTPRTFGHPSRAPGGH